MSQEQKLLPCPFCSAEVKRLVRWEGRYWVECAHEHSCPLHGKMIESEGWNTRAAQPQAVEFDLSPMAKVAQALREKSEQEWNSHPSNHARFCDGCNGSGWNGESRSEKCKSCGGSGLSRSQSTEWGPMPDAGTEADQPQAVEGLPERLDIPERGEYELDCHWAAAVEQAKSHNSCHDAFMPHVNAMAAKIAELEAALSRSNAAHEAAAQHQGDLNTKIFILEAQLARGKEGLPEPVGFTQELALRNFENCLVDELIIFRHTEYFDGDPYVRIANFDACAPVLAARDAEIERLRQALEASCNLAHAACVERDALRADKAELVSALQYARSRLLAHGVKNEIVGAYLAKHGGQS